MVFFWCGSGPYRSRPSCSPGGHRWTLRAPRRSSRGWGFASVPQQGWSSCVSTHNSHLTTTFCPENVICCMFVSSGDVLGSRARGSSSRESRTPLTHGPPALLSKLAQTQTFTTPTSSAQLTRTHVHAIRQSHEAIGVRGWAHAHESAHVVFDSPRASAVVWKGGGRTALIQPPPERDGMEGWRERGEGRGGGGRKAARQRNPCSFVDVLRSSCRLLQLSDRTEPIGASHFLGLNSHL